MATKVKHTHRLQKHKYPNGTAIFFCTLPDCHFKVEAALALGKECICNQCGESFIMNEYTLRLKRPHCANCGKIKVTNANGEKIYVNKRNPAIMEVVAANDVSSLRERLDSLTKDDDI